jgi:hypothetical protein
MALEKKNNVARDRIELPTRGYSEIEVVDSIHIFQHVTGASVAPNSVLFRTIHNYSTQNSRTLFAA